MNDRGLAEDKRRRRLHKPKYCTWWIYQIGWIVGLVIGLLVLLIGTFTSNLFQVYIYDQRHPALFRYVHTWVGFFSAPTSMLSVLGDESRLEETLKFSDTSWLIARLSAVLGILFALVGCLLHVLASRRRSFALLLTEGCFILLAVGATLVALSLAENEIEVVHDYGDSDLSNLLLRNNLLVTQTPANHPSARTALSKDVTATTPKVNDEDVDGSASKNLFERNEFSLVVTPTGYSFNLMIAADFLLLFAFLCFLVRFVRACEKLIEARRQLRKADAGPSTL